MARKMKKSVEPKPGSAKKLKFRIEILYCRKVSEFSHVFCYTECSKIGAKGQIRSP